MSNTYLPPKRRWFQFRLRTLLAAMGLLALPCAWVSFSLNWIKERHEMMEKLSAKSGAAIGVVPSDYAPGGLWLFGEPAVPGLWCASDDVSEVRRLFPEAKINALPLGWSPESP